MENILPVCRVCLKVSLEYIDLESLLPLKENHEGNSLTYLEAFKCCTKLDITVNDKFPKSLCVLCGNDLQSAYEFIKRAAAADLILRDSFESDSSVDFFKDNLENVTIIEEYENDIGEYPRDYPSDDSSQATTILFNRNLDESSNVCGICGKKFLTKFVLNLHIASHANAKKSKNIDTSPSQPIEDEDDSQQEYGQPIDPAPTRNELISLLTIAPQETDFFQEISSLPYDTILQENHAAFVTNSPVEENIFNDSTINVCESQDEKLDLVEYEYESAEDVGTGQSESENVVTSSDQSTPSGTAKKHACTLCNKVFRDQERLNGHMNVHEGITENCDFESKISTNLTMRRKEMIRTFSESGKSVQLHLRELKKCTDCGKEVVDLYRHRKRLHNPKRFKCNKCPKVFAEHVTLVNHQHIHDENRKRTVECKICFKKFFNNHLLQIHKRSHSQSTFQCNICGKKFFRQVSLNLHMKFHNGNTIKCEICSKEFTRAYDFKTHMLGHSGEKPHTCDICQQSFLYKTSLTQHMMKHSNLKYKCMVCYKEFGHAGSFRLHSYTHNGKPYPCPRDQCAKTFSRKTEIEKHMEEVHGEALTVEEFKDICEKYQQKRQSLESISC